MNEADYTKLITRLLEGQYRLEKDFQRDVIKLARMNGWWVDYSPRTRAQWNVDPGFGDLRMLHFERRLLVVRELKMNSNRLSEEQRKWLVVALMNGWDYDVWYPHLGIEIVSFLTNE